MYTNCLVDRLTRASRLKDEHALEIRFFFVLSYYMTYTWDELALITAVYKCH